jgi:hypothetical protein
MRAMTTAGEAIKAGKRARSRKRPISTGIR